MKNIKVVFWVVFGSIVLVLGLEGIKSDINGSNIQDLIEHKRIKVKFVDANIENIKIKVKNRRLHPIKIMIPTGTILSPTDDSYQNMLCFKDVVEKVNLFAFEKEIDVPVVCIVNSGDIEHPIPV